MNLNIKLKSKQTKEIQIAEGKSIVIDYPSLNQQEKLNEILAQIFAIEEELKNIKEPLQKVELSTRRLTLFERFMKYFIRYTLKAVKGYDFELKLSDNELDDETFEAVCYDPLQVRTLFEIISKELEFNELDKKK